MRVSTGIQVGSSGQHEGHITAEQVAAYWREQTGRESVLIDGYGRVELQALAEVVAGHWPDELGRCIGPDWRGYLSTAARYALNLGHIQATEPEQAPGYDPTKVVVKSPASSPSRGRYVSVADGIAEGWLDAHGNARREVSS